ncbi:PIN-like domain-containing protein [Halpernia frigidisoli]|uniref:PIN-like domain-containing protein n=1 Tax=Halpernia frigidisoli TaxID=1125876 RepID=UPI000AB29D40
MNDFIDNLEKLESKQSDVNDQDKIKEIVLEIFKDKIGKGLDKNTLLELYKEGEKRYHNLIPPGFKDSKKIGSHLYEDKEYIRKFGDLILWFEIIDRASKKDFKYIVLVTGDIKEDWWLEKRGRKLGPRLELLNEIYTKVPEIDTFYLYDTSTFLQYAQEELDDKIKDSSIDEAKKLIEFSKENRKESVPDLLNIYNVLKRIGNSIDGLKMGIGKSVKNLPLLNIDVRNFYLVLIEVLTNAVEHSPNGFVGIHADENENFIILKFRNVKLDSLQTDDDSTIRRGRGLSYIKSILLKESIDFSIYDEGKKFELEMFIPKNK